MPSVMLLNGASKNTPFSWESKIAFKNEYEKSMDGYFAN